MLSIISCPSWEVVSMKDVDTRRGLESQLASGNPTGAVSIPLCSGSSTGLSDASWPDARPDARPDASSLLVLVLVLPTSPFSSKVAVLCCCDEALVLPVAACV